jgi:hypothetical protein
MSQFAGLWRQGPLTPAHNTSNQHMSEVQKILIFIFKEIIQECLYTLGLFFPISWSYVVELKNGLSQAIHTIRVRRTAKKTYFSSYNLSVLFEFTIHIYYFQLNIKIKSLNKSYFYLQSIVFCKCSQWIRLRVNIAGDFFNKIRASKLDKPIRKETGKWFFFFLTLYRLSILIWNA